MEAIKAKYRERADWWLIGVCSARALSQVVFMTYAAAIPILQQEWGMTAVRAGTISSGFQLGYALSLLVMSVLADKYGPKALYVWSMFAGALLSTKAGFSDPRHFPGMPPISSNALHGIGRMVSF